MVQYYFEEVNGDVDALYTGAFSDELDFTGMAEYRGTYEKAMRKIDEKTELKSMEKNIYANVMVMTIFIALFALINIDVD